MAKKPISPKIIQMNAYLLMESGRKVCDVIDTLPFFNGDKNDLKNEVVTIVNKVIDALHITPEKVSIDTVTMDESLEVFKDCLEFFLKSGYLPKGYYDYLDSFKAIMKIVDDVRKYTSRVIMRNW